MINLFRIKNSKSFERNLLKIYKEAQAEAFIASLFTLVIACCLDTTGYAYYIVIIAAVVDFAVLLCNICIVFATYYAIQMHNRYCEDKIKVAGFEGFLNKGLYKLATGGTLE